MTPVADSWAVEASALPLAFAQVREDPRLDVALAESLPHGGTVVMIASGGDSAVCLGRFPLRLHLVDMNPAQVALSRVKWKLAGDADPATAGSLLGHLPLAEDSRWEMLCGIFGLLGLDEEIFGPRAMVQRLGPDHVGRYELAFAELRSRLAPWSTMLDGILHSEVPVMDVEDTPLGEAMNAAFAEVMTLENLVCLFGEGATRNPRVPFSEHFASRTHEVFRRIAPVSNPFLWQVLAGRFHAGHSYDWLKEKTPRGLSPMAAPHWHCGKMDEVLDSFPRASVDLIHLSNILDWLSPSEAHEMLGKVARVLVPGGRVMIRQLNSTLEIPVLESGFIWDAALGRSMERQDRSYFYPHIHIGLKA